MGNMSIWGNFILHTKDTVNKKLNKDKKVVKNEKAN